MGEWWSWHPGRRRCGRAPRRVMVGGARHPIVVAIHDGTGQPVLSHNVYVVQGRRLLSLSAGSKNRDEESGESYLKGEHRLCAMCHVERRLVKEWPVRNASHRVGSARHPAARASNRLSSLHVSQGSEGTQGNRNNVIVGSNLWSSK
jgi:hypothetical protein